MIRALCFVSLALASTVAHAACESDAKFKKDKWVVHPSDQFAALSQKILAEKDANPADFVYDTQGGFNSDEAHRQVSLISYDRLSTPKTEMWGDLVTIVTTTDRELVEVRWYDAAGKTKNLVFNPKFQSCATSVYDQAGNTLF